MKYILLSRRVGRRKTAYKFPTKYITCWIDGESFISEKDAIRMIFDEFSNNRLEKFLAEHEVKRFFHHYDFIVIVWPKEWQCFRACKVYVNGQDTWIGPELAPKSEQPEWGCAFTGDIEFPEEYQYLSPILRKFLLEKIFGQKPKSTRCLTAIIGVENAYQLLVDGKLSKRYIECVYCR